MITVLISWPEIGAETQDPAPGYKETKQVHKVVVCGACGDEESGKIQGI